LTYGSTKKIVLDTCTRTGASLVTVPIKLPIKSGNKLSTNCVKFIFSTQTVISINRHIFNLLEDEIVDSIAVQISQNTKAIIVDHITSNTALVISDFLKLYVRNGMSLNLICLTKYNNLRSFLCKKYLH